MGGGFTFSSVGVDLLFKASMWFISRILKRFMMSSLVERETRNHKMDTLTIRGLPVGVTAEIQVGCQMGLPV